MFFLPLLVCPDDSFLLFLANLLQTKLYPNGVLKVMLTDDAVFYDDYILRFTSHFTAFVI